MFIQSLLSSLPSGILLQQSILGENSAARTPFRETEHTIAAMKARGLLAVEMEAAALYAFAQARNKNVLCFAHVTNQMGSIEGDFEKGEADGTVDALAVIVSAARKLLPGASR